MVNPVDKVRKERMRLSINLPLKPEWISAASVFASTYVLVNPLAAVAAALFLDLLDGMIARARNLISHRGLLIDYACDRYSEYIIFGYYSIQNPLILLIPALNTFMTYMVLKKKRGAYILPVRHLLLAYLILTGFF